MNRVMQVLLTANNTNLTSVLAASSAQVQSFSRSAVAGNDAVAASATRSGTASKAMAAGLTVAAVAVGFAVTKAAEFDSSMRNVNSLLKLNDAGFQGLSASVLDMATVLPQSANTLAEGLYDIASSGFDGAEGLTVLEAAATAASAGLTTTEVAAKGITSVLNAYGLEAADAGDVSDILFKTVELGVVSFEELSTTLGDVVGTAAAAGISIDQVGAALATMTLSGISADEAGTSLNRLLQAIIDPSEELAASLSELGYESGASALETDGLQVVMEKLRVQTGGNIEELLKLFPEIRAARGALALMSNEGQNYVRVSGEIEDADKRQGATKAALDEQMRSASAQAQVFYNNIEVGAIKLGTLVLPMLLALMDGVRNVGELMGQVGAAVAPAWDSLVNVVENLWEILGNLYDAVSPVVEALVMVGGGIVIGGLTLVADALEAITGFLADNADVATALALTVGGLLVASFVRAQFAAIQAMAAMAGVSTLSMVGAVTGIAGLTGALAAARVAAAGLLSALGPIAVVAAGAVAVTGLLNIGKASGEAEEAVTALFDSIDDADSNAEAFDLTQQGIEDTTASMEQLQTKLDDMTSTTGVGDFFGDIFSYFADGPNAIGDTEAAIEEYLKALELLEEKQRNVQTNTSKLSGEFGLTEAQILALADATGIDLTQGFDKVEGPMRAAAEASKDVTAAEEATEAAIAGLEGGLLDAAEAADALKVAFEGLTGGFVGVTEAGINFEEAVRDTATAVMALIDQALGPMDNALDEATGGLDTHTAAGAEVFGMLTDLRTAGQDYIVALREQGQVEEAIAAEGALRKSLYDTLEAFGIVGPAADDLVNSLVGIPGEYTALIEVDTENAQAAIDKLQGDFEGLTLNALVDVAAGFTPDEVQGMVNDVMGTNNAEATLGLNVDEIAALQEISAITGIPYAVLIQILLDPASTAQSDLDAWLAEKEGKGLDIPFGITGVPEAAGELDALVKEPRNTTIFADADTLVAEATIDATVKAPRNTTVFAGADVTMAEAGIDATVKAPRNTTVFTDADTVAAEAGISATAYYAWQALITAYGDSSPADGEIAGTANYGWQAKITASADTYDANVKLNAAAADRNSTIYVSTISVGASKSAYGGAYSFAGGGVLDTMTSYASGGPLARQSERAPDGANLINWAEPGTGGELHIFVPLANDGRRESAKQYARMAVEELAMSPADLGWGASYANGGVRQPIPAMRGYAAMGAGTGSGAAPGGAALIAEVRALGGRIDAMSDRPFLADLRVLLDGELMNRAMHRIDHRNEHR